MNWQWTSSNALQYSLSNGVGGLRDYSGSPSPQYLRGGASALARAYNGNLGADFPAGSRDRAPGQGARGAEPPEAVLVFRRPANLPTLLKFGNAKQSDICLIFAKQHGWPRNWGPGAKLRGGLVFPWFRPKTTTAWLRLRVHQSLTKGQPMGLSFSPFGQFVKN